MIKCKCGSDNRFISVSAKCSDLCVVRYHDMDHEGYVPRGLGIGGGDYLEFDVCADCGRVKNFEPLTDSNIIEALG